MVRLEDIARAALAGDSLGARSLTQDFLDQPHQLRSLPKPETADQNVLALSAGLAELFASRSNQQAPTWTQSIGALDEPVFLVRSAMKMKRLRELCEQEAPIPLRKRRLYAPPNYLEFA
jgi:hypothetical protein